MAQLLHHFLWIREARVSASCVQVSGFGVQVFGFRVFNEVWFKAEGLRFLLPGCLLVQDASRGDSRCHCYRLVGHRSDPKLQP